MILLIDNYDSFTYNIYQAIVAMGCEIELARNDYITLEDVLRYPPSHIILSPGPKGPGDSGICPDLVRHFSGTVPILGICLGHQVIADVFGAKIRGAKHILHGKVSQIYHNSEFLFRNVPSPIVATRYHSLVVSEEGLPPSFAVTARSEDGEIMGLKHSSGHVYGLQFHPESILTEAGPELFRNFLRCHSTRRG